MTDLETAAPYVRGNVLLYQSCRAFSVCSVNPARVVSEALHGECAHIVVWDSTSAVTENTTRVHSHLCLYYLTEYTNKHNLNTK